MRPYLSKHSIIFSSSLSQSRAHVLQLFHFSSSSSSPSSSSYQYSRRHDDESRNVRVSVWWDFENCNLPTGVNLCKIAPAITDAVRTKGIKGPLQITAFGDVLQLSKANQEALAYTGIQLTHIPKGGKNSADRSLLVELMHWVSQNPPPAHLFLISGDKDFAGLLHRLRMNNYNILLATIGKAPDVLCSAATIAWQWSSLIKGEDLAGKHFNHPPDGPFGSWYGNYKMPLENPFSAVEQSTSSPTVEIYEPTSESKPGSLEPAESTILPPTTSAVKGEEKGCVATLKSNGVVNDISRDADETRSISSLDERIMDDDSKSFQQVPSPDTSSGEYVDGKASYSPSIETNVGQPPKKMQKSSLDSEKVVGVADAQLSKIKPSPKNNELPKTKTGSLKTSLRQSHVNDFVRPELVTQKIPEKYTTVENFADGNYNTTVETNRIVNDESEKFKAEDKHEKPARKEEDEVCRSPYSLPVDDSVADKSPGESAETYNKSPTFFGWIRSWWPFSKSRSKSDDLTCCQDKIVSHSEELKLSELDKTVSRSEELKLSELDQTVSQSEEPNLSEQDETVSHSKESTLSVNHSEEPRLLKLDQTLGHSEEPKFSKLNQNVSHSEKPVLFSSKSFWDVMESFVFSPKGSLIFSQSRSREDMAHKLQKGGPMFLRSLTEEGILKLVDLLMTEKKWLEERPSQSFPFKLTQPVQRGSPTGLSHGANGLRSLFLNRTPQHSLQKTSEHDAEKQNQSAPHTGVSKPATEKKYKERSRDDILADCQKLVKDVLREHPEGYNIGCFRKLFVQRYGYHLDVQKLGYKKLASLLQIMPGAKLESTFIFPSAPAVLDSDGEAPILKTAVTDAIHVVSNSDSELSDPAPKDENIDSPWEELGPAINNSNHSDLESKLSPKVEELYIPKHPNYEPIVSDDDSSESEGDSPFLTQPEEQAKLKRNENDSSLLHFLDLYERKEAEKLDSVEHLGNALADLLDKSTESTRGTFSKISSGNFKEKHRSQKSYSFVADPVLPNNKDKLIDGILDGCKESNMQN
ncbi:putative OST-HTH/LOTUS domain, OST-HTH associated domain, PIN domain-containing protein [Lupinus albus]|uniref:Putative OST-HTH/LOTUS domain, OST-HTH associated domain, PIN domain-containing protein n=1 Tax=Lupinus albus TaxID=3870 RepID=A0A6A4Q4U9_LUPAL|nr:putative OST-HTH/LOTUS domain, OST-HTH associated domain, PIN domain-containing protein [Lupinus albus]